jgi:hypothetical protein
VSARFDPPIFLNCRDRLSPLRALVDWLERAGHQRIVLVDNASTYEPLLAYLADTAHDVIRLAHNAGARSIWEFGMVPQNDWFAYSDPDIVPTDECPLDAVQYLHGLLDRHAEYTKAGLGLYLDDVPPSMPSLGWERGPEINGSAIEPGARRSLIDTTFALHRPGTQFLLEAIRTTSPYLARHVSPSWYCLDAPNVEDAYYLAHAKSGPRFSSWKGPDPEDEAEAA